MTKFSGFFVDKSRSKSALDTYVFMGRRERFFLSKPLLYSNFWKTKIVTRISVHVSPWACWAFLFWRLCLYEFPAIIFLHAWTNRWFYEFLRSSVGRGVFHLLYTLWTVLTNLSQKFFSNKFTLRVLVYFRTFRPSSN